MKNPLRALKYDDVTALAEDSARVYGGWVSGQIDPAAGQVARNTLVIALDEVARRAKTSQDLAERGHAIRLVSETFYGLDEALQRYGTRHDAARLRLTRQTRNLARARQAADHPKDDERILPTDKDIRVVPRLVDSALPHACRVVRQRPAHLRLAGLSVDAA